MRSLLPAYVTFILRFVIFAIAHSLLASGAAKRLISGPGKVLPAHRYRLAYNVVSLFLFGWVMSAYRTSPVLYFVPGIWSLLLYLLQAILLTMLFGCLKQTGLGDFTGLTRSGSPSSLVSTGWYARVRHPLYLLSILFLLSNPVMTAQWLLLTFLSAPYFIIGATIEEKRLVAEYGDQYRAYQKRVPFLIPRSLRPWH